MRVAKQARSENSVHDVWRIEQAFSHAAGVDLSQGRVVGRTEERKGRNQRARAHPGDRRKFRTRAGGRPAIEHTRAICAVSTAA